MPRKHKKKILNFYKFLGALALGSVAILGLIVVFMRPLTSKAGSQMEINGNGVLVRYNTRDGVSEVAIPQNVRAIGDQVFMGNKDLKRIYIPGTVEAIGSKAFYGCEGLSELVIEEGTREIKDSAFAMCTGLSRVYLPRSLKTLGNGVFAGDSSLYQVHIEGLNPAFFVNDNVIYNRDSTKLIEMVPGRQGESFDMPFTVKSIAPYAFWGAVNLKNVRVSNQVKEITPFAFTNATALEYIYLPNSVNSIQEYAFRDCSNLKKVAAEGSIGFIADSAFDGVSPKLKYSDNASYEAIVSDKKTDTSKKEAVSDDKAKSEKSEDKDDDENGQVSNGGEVVFNTPWGTRAPYKEIDTNDPDLYGTGKIVGGKTVIIPTAKQSYSEVSSNNR